MATTLRTLVEAVETALEAAPSLGIRKGDGLRGVKSMPQQRGSIGFWVHRELTRNLPAQTRNQDVSRVEDIVVITLQARIKPKDQRDSRGDLYDLCDSVLNRVTELNTSNRKWNPTLVSIRDDLTNEWLRTEMRIRFQRFQAVGGG